MAAKTKTKSARSKETSSKKKKSHAAPKRAAGKKTTVKKTSRSTTKKTKGATKRSTPSRTTKAPSKGKAKKATKTAKAKKTKPKKSAKKAAAKTAKVSKTKAKPKPAAKPKTTKAIEEKIPKARARKATTTMTKRSKARDEVTEAVRRISSGVAIEEPISPAQLTTIGFLGMPPYEEIVGEEYMNSKQLKYFRDLLERWKRALMEEVDRTMHHMKDELINYPDLSDRASQEEEFNLELRARDRERKLIKKIDEALERIDRNEYGYCEACGVEIGIRRLEARPTAVLCIDCKTLDEIREKTRA